MAVRRILAAGLVLAGLTGCGLDRPVMVVKPVHVANPPAMRRDAGADDNPLEVLADITPPKLIYGPEAEYSREARRKKETCDSILISLVVTKEGTVRDMLLTDSCPDLDANAMKAVATYRFKPGMRNGQPVAVRVTIAVVFAIY